MRHPSPTCGPLCALMLMLMLPACGQPAAAPARAALPQSFTDALVIPAVEKDALISKEGKTVRVHYGFGGIRTPFKMILIPGDPAKGIPPFYMGETEVTWDLFKTWSHWEDVDPREGQEELLRKERPSRIGSYEDPSCGMGYKGRPAMCMSRMTAETFCDFLSKKTGRHYRLPTEAEWDLAYQMGGGDPKDEAGKLAAAWCRENSDDACDETLESDEKLYAPRVGKVKTRAPNALGLYDMLGNVAEWVSTPGAADTDGRNTFVRGGDFLTPVAQLSGTRREESDNSCDNKASWNYTYPDNPHSKWWFKDHFQIGLRLVCEPVNLPKP